MSVDDYLIKFVSVLKQNEWSHEEKASQLLMSLKGPAFALIKDLRPKNKNQISMKLYALLKKRFSPKERETAHKDKCWTRRQLKNENVTDFGYAIQKLSYLAFTEMDTESCESLLVKHYTRGLSSYDTKRHVRLNQSLTLDKATSLKNLKYHIPTENPVILNKSTLYRATLINGCTGKKIPISMKMQIYKK